MIIFRWSKRACPNWPNFLIIICPHGQKGDDMPYPISANDASAPSDQIRIDLHVHTNRYSACAPTLSFDDLRSLLDQRYLEGIVVTEHDVQWSSQEVAAANRQLKHGRIYRGVEVSSAHGHFVVIGLRALNGINPGIAAPALVDQATRQQAAVIFVHPHVTYAQIRTPLALTAMPSGIAAIEVASSATRGNDAAAALKAGRLMNGTAVAGSDAHAVTRVGCCYTVFDHLPEDEAALARAIIDGRVRFVDRQADRG